VHCVLYIVYCILSMLHSTFCILHSTFRHFAFWILNSESSQINVRSYQHVMKLAMYCDGNWVVMTDSESLIQSQIPVISKSPSSRPPHIFHFSSKI
jgi:hypothetical protein